MLLRVIFLLLAVASNVLAAERITLTTLNCYWFFGQENPADDVKPLRPDEYSLKAGHLIGLLPASPPLFVGLQEIGNDGDVEALAHSASKRYGREFRPLFVQGKDNVTRQDVGALIDISRGWGVHGKPSRHADLEKELSKHLIVNLANATSSIQICLVHLRVPKGSDGLAKQKEQNAALLRWSMRHLANNPKGNVVIMGDFNEGKKPGSTQQSLAVLFKSKPPLVDPMAAITGKPITHRGGGAYDRVLISDALATGDSGWRFLDMVIGVHKHDARLYSDHFPVSINLERTQ